MIAVSQGRLQDRRPLSIIDIGSNSIRLVVYEGLARSPSLLFNEKMLAGLGRGIVSTGKLDPEAVTRSMEEFRRFRALSDQAGAEHMYVLATAAAREAINGPDFIHRAEDVLKTEIRVLTGRQEAYYSALGVISGFHPANGIAGDLGGGSLELIDINREAIGDGITLPLGGLRLQDMAKNSLVQAQKIARQELARAKLLKGGQGRVFYAVGGTWRNLARLHMEMTNYPLGIMHHYEISADSAQTFLRQVAKGEVEKVRGIEGVSKNRRSLLPYGAVVLQEIMAAMQPSKIIVSAQGVREGFLYSLLDPEEQKADPLISAAEELALLRSRSVHHAHDLVEWTGKAFKAFGIDETEDETRYRHAACLLADIGWRAHPEYRGRQSLNIIAHASFIGVDHPGRAYLALANAYRHDGIFNDGIAPEIKALAPPRLLERARVLAAMMRVVYLLTAAMPGVMPRLKWESRGNGALALVLPASLSDLYGERPAGRLAQLARITNRRLVLAVEGGPSVSVK
ncbi:MULTISPECIES: exopolyphosphatase [unclassified Mesorhizobium]|uniref:exopolyphosphatase n=2 Tax=Mesorhizobium TaxID=68287 RepID=UPI000F7626C0|nr:MULTISPECIES: exopolyphosphatase [unclassified Mesorhizobium]AZO06683.1 exopolyphosphatase [Mesorhizobium sp. M2A.F.Ca.ET.043.02.1.1]RUW40210.1 exopolyphosphatase [Mesorhizobium sp. M2A.F.Ca.ET.015.02.1.1]RVC95914.1 exopolyphosphatase [Mesorhizobium sp. M2A.F.Ca.ET.017.03.2.1]RVD08888.1 exopolyphosphatase [Mesorhizobium sp. M2A.F.Ca.ET.029.05.1.1]RWB42456.1 MAG: exopolyphosphatase [Mesorhizobium sp.]